MNTHTIADAEAVARLRFDRKRTPDVRFAYFATKGERWAREMAAWDELERLHTVDLWSDDAMNGDIRRVMFVAVFDGRDCGNFATGEVDREAFAEAYETFAELVGETSMGETDPSAIRAFLVGAQNYYVKIRDLVIADAPRLAN